MSPYLVYPLVAPLVFALAFVLYHWEKATWELVGWQVLSAYGLYLIPSLIVASVDSRALKRKSATRVQSVMLTMLLVTVVPFAIMIPQARFEGAFLMVMAIAAIFATGI